MGEQIVELSNWRREWLWEGLPVLRCTCTLPRFPGQTPAQRRMERYWRHWERQLLRWLARYHRLCCQRGAALLERSRPIPLDEVEVDCRVVWQGDGLLSLLVTLTAPGLRRYWPELWRLRDGTPVRPQTLAGLRGRLRTLGRPLVVHEEGVQVLDVDGAGPWAAEGERFRRKRKRLGL